MNTNDQLASSDRQENMLHNDRNYADNISSGFVGTLNNEVKHIQCKQRSSIIISQPGIYRNIKEQSSEGRINMAVCCNRNDTSIGLHLK